PRGGDSSYEVDPTAILRPRWKVRMTSRVWIHENLTGAGTSTVRDEYGVAGFTGVINQALTVWRPCQIDHVLTQEHARRAAHERHKPQLSVRKTATQPDLGSVTSKSNVPDGSG